jgi:hypothetical protein
MWFAWPYCKEQTNVPGAADFWMVEVGRATCEHCGKDFLVVENMPMTEEQYKASTPQGLSERESVHATRISWRSGLLSTAQVRHQSRSHTKPRCLSLQTCLSIWQQ